MGELEWHGFPPEFAFAACRWILGAPPDMLDFLSSLSNWQISQVTFWGIEFPFYFFCGVASLLSYFFKVKNGHSPSFDIVGHINPKFKTSPWCRLGEALLFALFGALLGTIFIQPSNFRQAVVAGLSWTSILTKPSEG